MLTGDELGDFQCWGWFFTASRRMVTQEYNLGDRGTITVAEEEILNPLAITGGTGDLKANLGPGGNSLDERILPGPSSPPGLPPVSYGPTVVNVLGVVIPVNILFGGEAL